MARNKNLVKSRSKNVQKQHIRRYSSGKVKVVNRGINKKKKSHNQQSAPRARPSPRDSSFSSQGNGPTKKQKPSLTPKFRPSEPDKKKVNEFAKMTTAALSFVPVAFKGAEGWYPESIKKQLPMVRLLQLMKSPDEFKEYATDEEAMAYISTMSMTGPPMTDLADIYQYLFNKTMRNVPPELKFEGELSKVQEITLKRLKRSIRKSQWKEFNGRK